MSDHPSEPREFAPRYALLGLAGLASCVVAALAAAGLFLLATGRSGAPPTPGRALVPPPPQLEVAGGVTLAEVRRRGAARLASWGWTDRRAGRAHIPIDRAMAITAARGWADARPAS